MTDLNTAQRIAQVEKHIRSFPDFPKPGIEFRDVFPIMKEPLVFADLILLLVEEVGRAVGEVDVVVGLDARGFIFAPLMALQLNAAFVPIRKAGKLPGECVSASYELEYGSDKFEAQVDAVTKGQRVIIVDDLLATGGTMSAACKLMTQMGADIKLCMVVIELADLNGRDKVTSPMYSLVSY